ncbi:MAG: hypothetical protein PVJ06_10320 [Desulfobacterales bacterium]|jgi:hypothetical protein
MESLTTMNYDEWFQQEDSSIIEIQALKKLFEDRPIKSTVTLNCKCSICGNEIILYITLTSGGFGLNGGFLLEHGSGKYLVACCNCYDLDKKTSEL